MDKLEKMVKGLRDRKKSSQFIREASQQIHQTEDEVDHILRQALTQLFAEDIRLLIKWKGIYKNLEQAMDYCDNLSNVIEGIIVEYE